jgi:tetratricopeptide (TPR) repeat protein
MNKRVFTIIFIFSLTSNILSASEDVILWDFGVKISPVKTIPTESPKTEGINKTNSDINKIKKAALSNRHIKPQIKSAKPPHKKIQIKNSSEKKLGLSTTGTENIHLHNFYLGKKEHMAGRYVSSVSYLENIDLAFVSEHDGNNIIYFHADALYQLGKYQRVIDIINTLKAERLNEELFLLNGFSCIKTGQNKMARDSFIKIIDMNPDSEYKKLSHLHIKTLSRN